MTTYLLWNVRGHTLDTNCRALDMGTSNQPLLATCALALYTVKTKIASANPMDGGRGHEDVSHHANSRAGMDFAHDIWSGKSNERDWIREGRDVVQNTNLKKILEAARASQKQEQSLSSTLHAVYASK